MKKTKCTICGEDAMPVYLRLKIEGEEKKGLQFCRWGTWCLNPECEAIWTDNGLYKKVPPDPVKAVKAQEFRERKEKEELKSILIEMIKEDPEFRKLLK